MADRSKAGTIIVGSTLAIIAIMAICSIAETSGYHGSRFLVWGINAVVFNLMIQGSTKNVTPKIVLGTLLACGVIPGTFTVTEILGVTHSISGHLWFWVPYFLFIGLVYVPIMMHLLRSQEMAAPTA